MTKLPSMTASDVIKKLKKGGFVFDRYAKGSHEIWYNPVQKEGLRFQIMQQWIYQKEH